MARQSDNAQEMPAWLDVMAEQVAIYDYRCRKFEAALHDLRRRYKASTNERKVRL